MKRSLFILSLVVLISTLTWTCSTNTSDGFGSSEWREYLGGPERNHYSPLKQIDSSNVKKLTTAWEYHTGDSGQMQCNPIIVDGIMYAMSAASHPFAVNAATGKQLWKAVTVGADKFSTSRGVTYWESGDDKRILYTSGPWMYAVNARTGKPVADFGENGRTSLKLGLGPTASDKMVISNTPGTVFDDLIVMPLRLSEGNDASLGHIQAFNIKTGKLAWVFHTIPEPGEKGYETWPGDVYKNKSEVGAANNWSGMSVDRKRGIIYVPTGSAASDFYGGPRAGANLFANCLLALDAKTGKLIWHFQLVHHDILDRDPPAPPNLITITRNGKKIDAVAQVTKQGFVFVFDRVTGEPLFPIVEKSVPASDIPGEHAWPTQPFPVKPEPYARQTLTEKDINPYSEDRDSLLGVLRKSRSEGPFTPLSSTGTLIYPGLDGGAEWGGAAVDPDGIMYVNSNEMAWHISLNAVDPNSQLTGKSSGQYVYTSGCTSCHGAGRKGNPASGYPALLGIGGRRTREYVMNIITNGKGMMPAFPKLTDKEKTALVGFLFGDEKEEPGLAKNSRAAHSDTGKVNYAISGYSKFLDSEGYPGIRPPWGSLNAIDLNSGEYLWKIPFGTYPELEKGGIPQTGSESYGGPVLTASGLLFIAGTKDAKLRVYSMKTGKLLKEIQLTTPGFATPSCYEVNGKQFIVIACGGTKLGAKSGDSYVAFSLP
jgi:quinoprotein glucose dehydrogenase